ncbi:MAG: hypothetical protein WC498_04010 [Candidatus Saccharimonadales bacterium]
MANRYVRLYPGIEKDTNIIGFSAGASDAPDHEGFRKFFMDRGYTISPISRHEAPEGSVSYRHVEVQPPLSEKHTLELGSLCVHIVDAGSNSTYVLDNRDVMPTGPYGPGVIVAKG